MELSSAILYKILISYSFQFLAELFSYIQSCGLFPLKVAVYVIMFFVAYFQFSSSNISLDQTNGILVVNIYASYSPSLSLKNLSLLHEDS